tara:strand:- start:527 stop:919 length:393 start_codon:yes stop_codon:yes gene_type:complete
MKDWGIGQVLLNSDSDSVTVFFSNVGKKMISLKHADLKKISGKESESSILDNIKSNEPEHKGKKLCKNCGQPTQFQETTSSYRYDLGWCSPCFSYGQSPFEDKETGKRPYFDELRTVDGIRKQPGSVRFK